MHCFLNLLYLTSHLYVSVQHYRLMNVKFHPRTELLCVIYIDLWKFSVCEQGQEQEQLTVSANAPVQVYKPGPSVEGLTMCHVNSVLRLTFS